MCCETKFIELFHEYNPTTTTITTTAAIAVEEKVFQEKKEKKKTLQGRVIKGGGREGIPGQRVIKKKHFCNMSQSIS